VWHCRTAVDAKRKGGSFLGPSVQWSNPYVDVSAKWLYDADSTLNVELAVRTNYRIDKHQAVFLSLGYMMLGSAIKDSPLTDRSGESKVFLGYLYRF
jgi:hypothetical protein